MSALPVGEWLAAAWEAGRVAPVRGLVPNRGADRSMPALKAAIFAGRGIARRDTRMFHSTCGLKPEAEHAAELAQRLTTERLENLQRTRRVEVVR